MVVVFVVVVVLTFILTNPLQGKVTMNEPFDEKLKDPKSAESQKKAKEVEGAVKAAVDDEDVADVKVEAFEKGNFSLNFIWCPPFL